MGTKCLSLAIIPTLSMILNEIIVTNVVVSRKIAMYQDTEIFHILFRLKRSRCLKLIVKNCQVCINISLTLKGVKNNKV